MMKNINLPIPVEITRLEAINLIEEALFRLENPTMNANGGFVRAGAVYWRLFRVLNEYALPMLKEDGNHGLVIIERHGMPLEFKKLPQIIKDAVSHGIKNDVADFSDSFFEVTGMNFHD